MSDYNFADELVQNTAVYASITFEEIVMIVIKSDIEAIVGRVTDYSLSLYISLEFDFMFLNISWCGIEVQNVNLNLNFETD